ncbi:uncharacterized protein LOC123393244 isoform X2 [Mustela putorius furo]|uniref:Uncharacterized protein LOC123393244 isoform X2 n=1 Tax=Mustela putorius furo TaxID=9669 RepID=A0A8U0SF84_MUSPF|nr:uncharacterized protein LOC123393244 isoform X2 [Mustela putorius furo]
MHVPLRFIPLSTSIPSSLNYSFVLGLPELLCICGVIMERRRTEFSHLWTLVSQSPPWQPDCWALHHCQPRGSERTSADVPRAPGSLRSSCSGPTTASKPGAWRGRRSRETLRYSVMHREASCSLRAPGPAYPCELPAVVCDSSSGSDVRILPTVPGREKITNTNCSLMTSTPSRVKHGQFIQWAQLFPEPSVTAPAPSPLNTQHHTLCSISSS